MRCRPAQDKPRRSTIKVDHSTYTTASGCNARHSDSLAHQNLHENAAKSQGRLTAGSCVHAWSRLYSLHRAPRRHITSSYAERFEVMRSSFVCAIAASITLAGCAGAGGGVLSSTKTPPLNATQDARTAVQAAMSPVSTGDLTSGLFGGAYGQPLVITSNVKTFQALSQQCVDRHEFFVTQISADETKYETKFFYDQACTQLANDVVADVTIPDASDESIVRKATWYDK